MRDVLPIVIIVIAVLLVLAVLIALMFWRKQKREKLDRAAVRSKNAFLIQCIIGLIIALTAALLMFDGDILGKDTIGIAKIIGSVGLCLIVTSFIRFLPSPFN